jgi:hypothetical protein
MPTVRAKLTGAEYAKLRTGKIPAGVKKAMRSTVTSIVRKVAAQAKTGIAKRTGLLSKSMGSVVRTYKNETTVGIAGPRRGFKVSVSKSEGAGKRSGLVGTTAAGKKIKLKAGAKAGTTLDSTRYAHLVERGTRYAKGRPFLGPAGAAANRTAKDQIRAATDAAIQQTR